MGAFKRLERVEDVGRRFLCGRVHQVINSQASYFLQAEAPLTTHTHGCKERIKHSLYQEQQILHNSDAFCRCHRPRFGEVGGNIVPYSSSQYRHGNIFQQARSVFGSESVMGSFICSTKGFATKRVLATKSDSEDEDDAEINLSDTSVSEEDASDVLSSEDEFSSNDLKQKQSHLRRTTQQTYSPQENEEDLDTADEENSDDELRVSRPWEMASKNSREDTGDQKRPLWLRLEEAVGKKTTTTQGVLNEWIADGNPICRAVIVYTITVLRRRRKYWRALEVSDWVMMQKPFKLEEMDYGIRVELIAKVQGAQKAAAYFATVPKEFQSSMVYSILLTAYVEQSREKEAVSLVEKVERLGLGHRTYMYNQLLYLYKKNGLMTGVAEVLQSMDQKNVMPDVHTYNIILDIRARKGDADGMKKVWARLEEDEDVEPDAATFAILAKGYLQAGLREKAEVVLKRVEESPFKRKRIVYQILLKLYGQIGNEEELERIWGLATTGPKVGRAAYIAMIRSLGKVGNSARAEDIFEEMQDKIDSLTVHHYNALLSVYASLGRTQKGESLLKQMARAQLTLNSATYHELVLMYLKARQEQKAMEVLAKVQKASQSSIKRRPLYSTFQAVLEWFAENGNVKNAEKVIRDLKNAGYVCSYRSYIVLLKAYENGRMSPYGFLDRLRADNIIPNQLIRKELQKLDGT